MVRLVQRNARKTLDVMSAACLFALLGIASLTGAAYGLEDGATKICQPTIWEVSTRSLNCSVCSACESCQFPTYRYECGSWSSSSEDSLIAEMQQDPQAKTILYVHGNRTSREEARGRALELVRRLSCLSDEPVRLILFSWPSEKPEAIIPKRIVAEKKATIQVTAFYLAGLLGRFPPDEVEGLVGYSFGCAITCAALHLQAGGTLCGRTIESQYHLTKSVRLGFIAPAFDRNALTDCGEYSQAPNLVEALVNLYNSNDPILKRFRLFDSVHPDAAGLLGLVPSQTQPLASEGYIVQFDCSSIGRTHSERNYFYCNKLDVLLRNALGQTIER